MTTPTDRDEPMDREALIRKFEALRDTHFDTDSQFDRGARYAVKTIVAMLMSGDFDQTQAATIAALRQTVERLEGELKSEADYCYGWAKHYADSNPERAARHRERGDRLSAALQGADEGGSHRHQADALDLMRDEFIRIKALSPSDEVDGIATRAISEIERRVPVVLELEEAKQALRELEQQKRDTEFLYHAFAVLCWDAGLKPGSRELLEAADRFDAALGLEPKHE